MSAQSNLMGAGFSALQAQQLAVRDAGTKTIFGNSFAGGFAAPPNNSLFSEEGNLYRKSGNPIAGNGTDTTDDILWGIVIPANAFDIAGRGICVTAQGSLASNGNNKRYRIWMNPTMAGQTVNASGEISGGTVSGVGPGAILLDSGVVTASGANGGWSLFANFFKFGAAGSNTQYSQGSVINANSHAGIAAPTFPTLAENAAMNLVVTGSSSTTGAANDVVLAFFEVNAMD